MPHKILIVDDDELVLLSLKLLLEENKFDVVISNTPERIPAMLRQKKFHAVLLDMNFRQGDTSSTQGLFWLDRVKSLAPEMPIILVTAYGEIPLAVEAMKRGAYDFITKPWQNEKMMATVKNAITHSNEKKTGKQEEVQTPKEREEEDLIGQSAVMEQVRKTVEKIAPTDAAVLIQGGNGTGKEVLAHEIHRQSLRANKIFVSVDVGALSETLFESELFGHKRGAFTDACEDRIGRIEGASGGTLFLDEIGNLSPAQQAKLLTVLQNKSITRLGTNTPVHVDFRIICATNSDLREQVREGAFREDLYYRINTVEITLPALCERPEDILLLADYFLHKYKTKYDKADRQLPDHVLSVMKEYRWPGNVRELQHAIERAVIMSETSELNPEDMGIIRNVNSGEMSFDKLNLEKLEDWAIRKALAKHKGNVSQAAEELGLSRGALYRRLEKYGI